MSISILAFTMACLTFSCRTGSPTGDLTPLDEAGKKRLQSIHKFTVIVTSGGSEAGAETPPKPSLQPGSVVLSAYRGSQVFERTTALSVSTSRFPRLDEYWGKQLETIFMAKGLTASYIPIEKLALSAYENDGDRAEWMKAVGIDTIVLVRQKKLVLDHSTRLPANTTVEVLATVFLWADFWWIDSIGSYFLENEVDVAFLRPGSLSEEGAVKGLYAKHGLGVRRYGDLQEEMILKAIQETNEKNLLTLKEGL